MDYDGGDERGRPLWDRQTLELGRPQVMDIPTFIEWLERQLETSEETEQRMSALRDRHVDWNVQHGYICSCCINWRGQLSSGACR